LSRQTTPKSVSRIGGRRGSAWRYRNLPSVTIAGDGPFGAQTSGLSRDVGLACTESFLEFVCATFAKPERAKQTRTRRLVKNLENLGCLEGGAIDRPNIEVQYGGKAFHLAPVATVK
jgi:hypothetical protein